eukprot:6039040-Pyramimonas_sp.AAC.1
MWPNPRGVSAAERIPELEADMFIYYDKQQVPHQNRVNILSGKNVPNGTKANARRWHFEAKSIRDAC